MKQFRVYANTSVFGGCFDKEFADSSNEFFRQVEIGIFKLIISPVLLAEINEAPRAVRNILANLSKISYEIISFTDDIEILRGKYIDAGVITNTHKSDAEHVASATISNADFIVSWNFKHIVHFDKIKGFQNVNLENGYNSINIFSPQQVV